MRSQCWHLTLSALAILFLGCTDVPRQSAAVSGGSGEQDQPIVTLNSALAVGDALLTAIRGTGASSGNALTARLQNATRTSLRLGTRLTPALYFVADSESAQNMLATQIYGDGGAYLVADGEPFIEIPAGASVPVTFGAYCVDLEKDNPTATNAFTLAEMPATLASIAAGVSAYEASREYGEAGLPRAQVALWLAQGEDPDDIRSAFDVSDADLAAAANLGIVRRQ